MMEELRYLKDTNVKGKRVLLRLDIPLNNGNGDTPETSPARQILATASHLLKEGAALIILGSSASYGKADGTGSFAPLVRKWSAALGTDLLFAPEPGAKETEAVLRALQPGQAAVLENLALYPGEEANDPSVAAFLAGFGDIYVNDAFASAAGRYASTVSLPALFREKAAGLVIENEIKWFNECFNSPKPPLLGIVGGLRLSSRLDLLVALSRKVDKLIISGGVSNTFLAAQGIQVGRSVFEKDLAPRALEVLGMSARRDCKVYLPVDFQVAPSSSAVGLSRAVPSLEIPADTMALDIGPASIALFQEVIRYSDSIFWTGSMGASENEEFSKGTQSIVEAISASPGLAVVAGKSAERAVSSLELNHKFDLISSGPDSFIALIEGEKLPGLDALRK